MNILYLTHTITWRGGGIFFTAYHQGRHLAKRGHKITLACISPTNRFRVKERTSEGVRILEFPDLLWGKARSGWDVYDSCLRVVRLLGSNFDIVHGYESRPAVAFPALVLSRMLRKPLVFTWADWFGKDGKGKRRGRILSLLTSPVENFFENHVYPKADFCIAMGEPLAERARSLGISQKKVGVLLHGCDPEKIRSFSVVEARNKLEVFAKESIALGYLGVLRPENADLLFQSYRRIKSRLSQPCRLILIGNTKLDWREHLPDELRSGIVETGWLSYESVNYYLSACDLLLLPLKKEIWTDNVWPSKINDYLSAARPIVSTRMKVLEPVFSKYNFGRLCGDNPAELAESCLNLLGDPTLRHTMSANARSVAEGELSWKSIVDKLEKIYLGVLSSRS